MTEYTLQTIPNTEKYVEQELITKHPDSITQKEKPGSIIFQHPNEDINTFTNLLSPLRIEKENGWIRNLYRRDWKLESVPASINPALAYIMCMIAEVNEDDIILDPFCGSGTIGITAAKHFNPIKVLCSDVKGKAVDITMKNARAAGVKKNRIVIFRSNVNRLRLQKGSVTKIITNMPFGIRTGSHDENIKTYKSFAQKARKILKENGKLVILTQEKNLLTEVFKNTHLKLIKQIPIQQGGLKPVIFVFTKVESLNEL